MLLTSRFEAEKRGLKPAARLLGYAFAGVEPGVMGLGPIPAVQQVLAQTGLTVADIDVIESNEAFAAQALAVTQTHYPLSQPCPCGIGLVISTMRVMVLK